MVCAGARLRRAVPQVPVLHKHYKVYIYIYIHTYAYMHTYIHAYIHAFMHTCALLQTKYTATYSRVRLHAVTYNYTVQGFQYPIPP